MVLFIRRNDGYTAPSYAKAQNQEKKGIKNINNNIHIQFFKFITLCTYIKN